MISVPHQIAAADGLREDDRDLVLALVKSWKDHVDGNLRRHMYYLMHNRLVDLGISVPPELRNLDAACGWAKKCVDVMVEHSRLDGWTAADGEVEGILDAAARRNKLRTLYRKATTSAFEQCFNLYLVTRRDDGLARVSAYPAHASGVVWDDAEGRLGAAMFVVSLRKERGRPTGEPEWVDVVTDEFLIRLRAVSRGFWAAEYVPHGLGHLPAFLAAYEPTLTRPFGTSRITREVMGYIDSAVRANVNEEIAAAFAAAPQKYLLGTDGDPFVEKTRWEAFIGSVFNIDMTGEGTVPQFGQLAQASMQPLSDHFRNLCGKMSAATGIHVSQFGQVHDNPASSDAIYAENEPLVLKVRDWNDDVSEVLADVANAVVATELGLSFDEAAELDAGIEARFSNPAMPTLAQQTDASVKIASVVPEFAKTDTFWEMNGFSGEERSRIRRELSRADAVSSVTEALNGAGVQPEGGDSGPGDGGE